MQADGFREQFTAIADAWALAQGIVDTVREPVLVLDKDLRVIAASRSFYSAFKVSPADTKGRLLYTLGDGQWAGHSFRERPRRTVFAIGRPTPTGDWGKIVADINENQHHSRPSRFTLLIAVGVVLGVGVIAYWAEISAFAHLPQLKQILGL